MYCGDETVQSIIPMKRSRDGTGIQYQ